jgi:hypothetical protein
VAQQVVRHIARILGAALERKGLIFGSNDCVQPTPCLSLEEVTQITKKVHRRFPTEEARRLHVRGVIRSLSLLPNDGTFRMGGAR